MSIRQSLPGANSETARRENLRTVVRQLHLTGPSTRSDIVGMTGLNRSTVAALVGELVEHGLVFEEKGHAVGLPGRPSPTVHPASRDVVVLALEAAVDSLAVALVGLGGTVHRLVRVDRARGRTSPTQTVDDLAAMARALLEEEHLGQRLVGVGVSAVALVRSDGSVAFAPNLGWGEVPLAQLIANALDTDLPVVVGNEANLGALAEHRRGAAAGANDLIYLSGEVGVGAGVIVGGQPLAGSDGFGGEVGHIAVHPEGLACGCGSRGCWETAVGERALLRHAGYAGDGGREAVEAVFAAAAAGQPHALRALYDVGLWLGVGLAALVNIFNPRVVVLGTLFSRMHPYTEVAMTLELRSRALAAAHERVTILPSRLGVDAPLLGAAELAFTGVLEDPIGWTARNPSGRADASGPIPRSAGNGGLAMTQG